jgi:hypothetical protein
MEGRYIKAEQKLGVVGLKLLNLEGKVLDHLNRGSASNLNRNSSQNIH